MPYTAEKDSQDFAGALLLARDLGFMPPWRLGLPLQMDGATAPLRRATSGDLVKNTPMDSPCGPVLKPRMFGTVTLIRTDLEEAAACRGDERFHRHAIHSEHLHPRQ